MKKSPVCLALLLALLAGLVFQTSAQAAKGTPDSPDFGYGAQIHLEGKNASEALQTASQLKLDWIQIDFDWAARWPQAGGSPFLQDLDQAMQSAGQQGLAVLLSLSDAPAWASSTRGPDPEITAQLLVGLAKRYPDSLKGIELFPAANTILGWGAIPNPEAYADLFRSAADKLQANGLAINLIAAGLTPLGAASQPQDMDDLVFLNGLYASGAADDIAILSLRFDALSGDPLQAPVQNSGSVLRHYEAIRQVMLSNRHAQGILWITHLPCPSGTIQADPFRQAAWLSQAYRQLRAQLYIGAAFVADLNPSREGDPSGLIAADGSRHPFLGVLGQLIAQNNRAVEASAGPASSFIQFVLHLAS